MTKEEIGRILKSAREQAGLTQAQVAEKLGKRQQAIGNWETGYAQPDANTIFLLCNLYDISIDSAFGTKKNEKLTTDEWSHIKKYRSLDEHGKEVIDNVLDMEFKRCQAASSPSEVVHYLSIPVYDDPAAAGSPSDNSSDYDYIRFLAEAVPDGTDFGVRISGDSMEPTIPNGAVVFVARRIDLSDGDVGIYQLRDGAVCKRLSCTDNGRVLALTSDNECRGSITGADLDGMRAIGKVIGSTTDIID